MKRDTDMIVRQFPREMDEVEVYPIGDVHLGAQEHMADAWRAFVDSVKAKPNAFLVLIGDLINNGTRTSVTNIFEETMRPADQKRQMAEMLRPLRDRILAIIPGNHEARSGKDADDDPTYDICMKLDIEDVYRPNAAFIKLTLGDRGLRGHERPAFVIAATHGAGGGIYTGAAVNRNERWGNVIDGVDVLIVGHSHKAHVTKPMKIVVDPRNNVIKMRPYYVVGVSSWMEYGGYAMRKMLLPSSHAAQTIRFKRLYRTVSVTME